MPKLTECIYEATTISVDRALRLRQEAGTALVFLCPSCRDRVKAHSSGGHTGAHFEHLEGNSECPYGHYYTGPDIKNWQDPDDKGVFEGYFVERSCLAHHRNAGIVAKCKQRDGHTCKSCGFNRRFNGRSIIECHHLHPISAEGARITVIDDLISLCPTCHRIAHLANPPLSAEQIKGVMSEAPDKAIQMDVSGVGGI